MTYLTYIAGSMVALLALHQLFVRWLCHRKGRSLVEWQHHIFGHRGCRFVDGIPENTIAAFEYARANGAGGVELDVMLCKSGELVVFHDDTPTPLMEEVFHSKESIEELDDEALLQVREEGEAARRSGDSLLNKKISTLTLDQLRTLRYKDDPTKTVLIPTLDEAMMWCASNNMKVFIEVKDFSFGPHSTAIAEALKGCYERSAPIYTANAPTQFFGLESDDTLFQSKSGCVSIPDSPKPSPSRSPQHESLDPLVLFAGLPVGLDEMTAHHPNDNADVEPTNSFQQQLPSPSEQTNRLEDGDGLFSNVDIENYIYTQTMVMSFNCHVLHRVRSKDPNIAVGLLTSDNLVTSALKSGRSVPWIFHCTPWLWDKLVAAFQNNVGPRLIGASMLGPNFESFKEKERERCVRNDVMYYLWGFREPKDRTVEMMRPGVVVAVDSLYRRFQSASEKEALSAHPKDI